MKKVLLGLFILLGISIILIRIIPGYQVMLSQLIVLMVMLLISLTGYKVVLRL